jgi:DNA polymerase I-like protein with 3'-5' exonuclease and polymerase domains/uracil-DNA glycosylase
MILGDGATPGYRPEALGARCDRCYLRTCRDGGPIGPELGTRARFAVVGEGPGEDEVALGRPFVGRAGKELDASLKVCGVDRPHTAILNAFACRPPDNDYEALERKRRKANKYRESNGEAPWLSPVEACRPRLLRELAPYRDVITVGARGLHGVTGVAQSITAVRGGMLDGWLDDWQDETRFYGADGPYAERPPTLAGRRIRLLPTLHPAFVLRARRWTRVFRSDLHRAVRWFGGAQTWREPRITYRPSPAQLRAFLSSLDFAAYDVETDGIEPLTCKLRCIGIGTSDDVYLVPLLGIDGRSSFYTSDAEGEIRSILREYFADVNRVKTGHNAGYYDRMVIEQHFGVTPKPLIDTIMLHRATESELPHSLGFVASVYADLSPAWKADRTATTAETDQDLWRYCGIDVAQNMRIFQPLYEHAQMRTQLAAVRVDHGLQAACVSMHRNGMWIDQRRRAEWAYYLSSQVHEYKTACVEICENPKLNPGSVHQIRELLYERWALPIPDGSNGKPKITKGGDPSTDDEAIRALRIHPGTPARAIAFLDALRRYRARQKLLGTYVAKLIPANQIVADVGIDLDGADPWGLAGADPLALDVDVYEEAERRQIDKRRQKERQKGIIGPRGRVYPTYNAHVTVVGRIAASSPNTLNVPSELRDMFAAEPGHILIGADKDQIHLRIAAARWGIARYLEAFTRKADPHATTAYMVFGDRFQAAEGFPLGHWDGDYYIPDPTATGPKAKWKGAAKGMRDLAKRVQYASLYKATVETVWRVISSSEDNDGNLIYASLKLPQVREMYEAWIGGVPEVPAGWEREMAEYRDTGHGTEPILGRRRDFLDSQGDKVNENEVINFPILGAEGSIMSQETIYVDTEFPPGHDGPGTGLINQNYDSMLLEVKAENADHAKVRLETLMTQTYDALPGVVMSAAAQKGRTWKEA